MYLERMKTLSDYLLATAVKYVLFVSSTSVYPDVPKEMYERDADVDSYLVRAERYFLEHLSVKTTVLRFGGLIGPGRHPGKFLAGKTGLSGAHHPVNVIHQQDCTSIIIKVLELGCWGEILNACCDVHIRREDFYTAAATALHLPPPEFVQDQLSLSSNDNSSPVRDQLSSKTVNSDKLKRLLNFQYNNRLVLDLLSTRVS
jgi:nucleoside-diphosphate-sugar epimerase